MFLSEARATSRKKANEPQVENHCFETSENSGEI